MRLEALLAAAWAVHLELATLAQLAACCRRTHSEVTPVLASICRFFLDELEQQVLRAWSRAIADGSETTSDED